MTKIFWVTCPYCLKRFYCHYQDLRHTRWELLCPFCQRTFRQEESPRIEE